MPVLHQPFLMVFDDSRDASGFFAIEAFALPEPRRRQPELGGFQRAAAPPGR
jgi:hypothetical protein